MLLCCCRLYLLDWLTPIFKYENDAFSHVTMSVSKLLSRIVSPQDINRSHNESSEQKIEDYAWEVHKSTYGTCVFIL